MCITHVRKYIHQDGREETFEEPEFCKESIAKRPCRNHLRKIHPTTILAPGAFAPSLVDDLTTQSSGSFPPTPVSATSGVKYELRQPPGPSKGKEKVRQVNEIRIDISRTKTEANSRSEDRSSRARFADASSDGTARPSTSTSRGRSDQPSPSIRRSAQPSALGGSPLPPRSRRSTPTEVHQPDPPPSARIETPRYRDPTPFASRRSSTSPPQPLRPSSSRAEDRETRAQARENSQREERNHRRFEEERQRLWQEQQRRQRQQEQEERDRRLAQDLDARLNLGERPSPSTTRRQDADDVAAFVNRQQRERAEDEYSRLEYERLQGREALRQSRRQAEEDRLRRERDELRENNERLERLERLEREQLARERRMTREEHIARLTAELRQAEETLRTFNATTSMARHHEEQRRLERRLQDAVAQMARPSALADDDDITILQLEIRRLTSDIQYEREVRRAHERDRTREDDFAAERRHLADMAEEIRLMEETADRNDEIHRIEAELRELDRSMAERRELDRRESELRELGRRNAERAAERAAAAAATAAAARRPVYAPSPPTYMAPPAAYMAAAYTTPAGAAYGTPVRASSPRWSWGSGSGPAGSAGSGTSNPALSQRSPADDIEYRRQRGAQVLAQEQATARARASALNLQRSLNGYDDDDAFVSLGRRNTIGGGARRRETAYRRGGRFYR